MSEYSLKPRFALNTEVELSESWDGFSINEIAGQSFWWLAVGEHDEAALSKLIDKHLGATLPDPGRSTMGTLKGVDVRLDWAGRRQWLLSGSFDALPKALVGKGHFTDQSDGWVGVVVRGHNTRSVFEKLCGLDLHPDVFGAGQCARVPVETMSAMLACENADTPEYRLMFQRSSARSFVDHMRHAAYSSCGEKIDGKPGENPGKTG